MASFSRNRKFISSVLCNPSTYHSLLVRSVASNAVKRPLRSHFRTEIIDVSKQTPNHEGMFYSISSDDVKKWHSDGFSLSYKQLSRAFQENTLMIRQPAIEIINYLKCTNYRMPSIRYVLFGRSGCGKTCSLMHVAHYCGQQDYIIFHVPWFQRLTKYFWDEQPSPYKSQLIDRPHDGIELLTHFRNMNDGILRKINLSCSKQYIWSKREFAEPGTPILDIIEFGLARPKYACDIIGIIVKELKLQGDRGELPPILVAIEGVNAAWGISKWCMDKETGANRNVDDINLVRNIKKLLKNDWSGASIVCTVDTNAASTEMRGSSFLPQYLLQKDGFNLFEPHIGIHVPNYSEKEINSCLDYYTERKWIQNPGGLTKNGRDEIIFLCGHNPEQLHSLTCFY